MAKDIDRTEIVPPTDRFDNMVRYLSQVHPLSTECIADIRRRVVVGCFAAKTVLLQPGQVCYNLMFVDEGCMASSEMREGKLFYNWIVNERNFATSGRCFYNQTIASEKIECIEPSVVIFLAAEDHFRLLEKHHDYAVCMYKMLNYISSVREVKSALTTLPNAESRVRRMAMLVPHLFNRVPLNIMATYLGMTPETLSRITHKKDFAPLLAQSNEMI